MDIDIVIATADNISTKNSSIYYTVRSILTQEYPPKQIFVSANSEYEDMKSFLKENFGDFVITIDAGAKSHNISFARNLGAKHCTSDIIVFIDDDVVIGKDEVFSQISYKMQFQDFYCGAKRHWAHPYWDKYLDKTYSLNHIRSILAVRSFLPVSIDRFSGRQYFHDFSFIGNFGAIRREVFLEVGEFDEVYEGWTYQDNDLMMRLCARDFRYQLMASDSIFVYHLSHNVDKSASVMRNKEIYEKKLKSLGINFHLNHFFGVFDDDGYAVISKIV